MIIIEDSKFSNTTYYLHKPKVDSEKIKALKLNILNSDLSEESFWESLIMLGSAYDNSYLTYSNNMESGNNLLIRDIILILLTTQSEKRIQITLNYIYWNLEKLDNKILRQIVYLSKSNNKINKLLSESIIKKILEFAGIKYIDNSSKTLENVLNNYHSSIDLIEYIRFPIYRGGFRVPD